MQEHNLVQNTPTFSDIYQEASDIHALTQPTLTQTKATLLQERKEQKQVDLGLFNSSRSATPKDGYVRVNDSSLTGTIVPGVSSGYYPQELVNQYQEPTNAVTGTNSDKEYQQQIQKAKYDDMSGLDRVVNAVKGAGYYFGSGLQDTADAVVEGVGKAVGTGVSALGFKEAGKAIDAWDPIGTEEEKSEKLKEVTGFNSYGVDQAMERAKGYIGESLKGVEATDPSTWGKATAGGFLKALGEVVTQPELALSLLYIAGPNMVVGGGTKLASLTAAKLAKDGQALDNVIKVVNTPVVQESMKVAALGGAINNNDLDSLQATLGKDAEGNPNQVTMERALLGWAMSSAAASLDKMAYDKIVGGIGTKPLKEVFQDIGESKARALVGTLVYGAGVAAKAGVLEAPQEFVQSYVEAFNGAYGGKNKDGSTITAKQALNDGLTEAVVGGIAGLSAGTYASAGTQVGRAGLDVVRDALPNNTTVSTAASTKPTTNQPAKAPTEASPTLVNRYTNTLLELREAVQTNAITPDTVSNYIDKVESLYDIRTGIEGFTPEQLQKADDTYKAIAGKFNEIILSNPELRLSKVATPEILGSAPTLDDRLNAEQIAAPKGETNATLAERVLTIALDTAAPEDVNSNAVKYLRFAVNNGISKEEAIQLVKNYASVEEEATVGDRGYKTYAARAKAIQTSDKPDEAQVNLVANKLDKFMVSVDNSASQLEDLINRAESVAAKYNKSGPAGFMGKTKERIKGEYKKLNGEPYSVDVVKKDGKWVVANDRQARDLLATKRRYVQEMRAALDAISGKRTDVPFNLGEFVVPVDRALTAGVKKAMSNDKGFINNSLEAASKLVGKKAVTRVIVDSKDHSDKWKSGSEYQRHNSEIVNRSDYTSNDVVLVHSTGAFKNGASTLSTTKAGLPEAEQFKLAIAAGSSIILDRDFVQQKGDKAGTLNRQGQSLANVLTSKGYVLVPGTKGMFVKNTDEVRQRLEAVAKEHELVKVKKKELSSLVDMAALLVADEQGVVALNPEAKTAARAKYESLREGAIRKYFTVSDKEGKSPEEKLQSYIDREIEEAIQKKVERFGASIPGVSEELDPALAVEHKKDEQGRPTNLGTGNIALAYLAKKRAEDQMEESLAVNELLINWKALLDQKLSTKETNEQLVELIKKAGMDELLDSDGNLLQLNSDLLEKSQSKGKADKFEVTYESGKDTTSTTVADTVATDYNGKPITAATKVAMDINKFVSSRGATLLSTIPVSSLPTAVRNEVEQFKAMFTRTVKGRSDGSMDDKFWLTESPGRAIVFNEKGTISPQVMGAMWLSLMEMMKTDKYKLVLGARSKKDVAQQLNIPETSVTKEQVAFAKANGMLNKTVANSLGKAVLAELGLGKKGNDEVAKGHYETLAADLGNMAITTAVKMGWLSYTTPTNTEVSKFYNNSDNVSEAYGDKEVRFVNISKSMVDSNTKELQGSLSSNYKVYENTKEMLPVVGTARKEPFKKLTEKQVEDYTSSVRNDGTGGNHKIPAVAVETLKNLMTTDYTFDVSAAQEFLDLVEMEGSTIKEQLGYIEISDKNPKYVELTFEAKDIQEGINRSIDKSIEELKVFVAKAENGESYNVQFPFYYTSNGRYMVDSNTINPQSDKVHRFLVQPAAHRLEYTVTGEGGSALFTVNGKDTSYYVRVALAQAFGLDIDKLSTKDIVKAGSELLSLSADSLEVLKKEMVTKGKAKLSSGLEVEATHISHTLQGIKFLQDTKSGKVTSSLTAEFDSVTNGFMNKLMQLPVLSGVGNSMKDHLARVGILSKSYVEESINGLPPLKELLVDGEAVNVILSKEGAARGLLDSYKNLASYVGARLAKDKKKEGFDKLWEFLPKPEGEDNTVSSALRSLFKAPFMTFNYSASIKNIKENLSYELVDGLFTTIAKGGEEGTAVAKAMFAQIPRIRIGDKEYIGNAAGVKALIEGVRSRPSSSIRASRSELREVLKDTMLNSYGLYVQEAFDTTFKPYIDIQDSINDAFRISYRLFEKEFNRELDALQRSKKVLSEKDYKDTITKLWDKFPAIRGPLSEAIENGFDVIPVVSSKSSSGSGDVTYRDRAATVLNGEGTAKTRKQVVRAVMKLLAEAGKAGSVIPFHYIDGAEMGRTVNDLHGKRTTGVTAIHDALMVPLDQFDEATLAYNKNTVRVNKEYNLLDALLEMVNKWPNSAEIEKAGISADGLVTGGGSKVKKGKPAHEVARLVREKFVNYKTQADEFRDIIFNSGDFEFNNLVGTAGGVYKGNTEVDYSYLGKVAEGYVNTDTTVVVEKEQDVSEETIKLEGGVKGGTIEAINNLAKGKCK